jgi:flagellar biosynthesis protein FliQ
MTPEQMTYVMRHTLWTTLEIAAPFLLITLLVGMLISLFQSMTHMQEMTLTFVPKMFAVAVLIAILFPWMLKILTKFTHNLLIHQWDKIAHAF